MSEIIVLQDCPAVLVPSAQAIVIKKNTKLLIKQNLGGHVTVFIDGNLARIDGIYAKNLGLETNIQSSPADLSSKEIDGYVKESDVWGVLRECYDPEIPVNIVELGLIYKCVVKDSERELGSHVYIEMTLTAPACSMGPILVEDIKNKLSNIKNITSVQVDLVFDPPWDMSKLTEEAKLSLGLL